MDSAAAFSYEAFLKKHQQFIFKVVLPLAAVVALYYFQNQNRTPKIPTKSQKRSLDINLDTREVHFHFPSRKDSHLGSLDLDDLEEKVKSKQKFVAYP